MSFYGHYEFIFNKNEDDIIELERLKKEVKELNNCYMLLKMKEKLYKSKMIEYDFYRKDTDKIIKKLKCENKLLKEMIKNDL